MVYLGKKKTIIGSGIKTSRSKEGFVTYSCDQHGDIGVRKQARKHYMKVHLGY